MISPISNPRCSELFKVATLGALLATLLFSPALAADRWTVDAGASRLTFEGKQAGASFTGRFEKWSANIVFNPENPEAGSVVVDIDMTSATTGDVQRDANLPTPNWLNSAAQPSATFISASVRGSGPNMFEADGILTIRGIAKTVTLPFELIIKGDTAKMSGNTAVQRSDFEIGNGIPPDMIGAEVTVGVQLTATRAR